MSHTWKIKRELLPGKKNPKVLCLATWVSFSNSQQSTPSRRAATDLFDSWNIILRSYINSLSLGQCCWVIPNIEGFPADHMEYLGENCSECTVYIHRLKGKRAPWRRCSLSLSAKAFESSVETARKCLRSASFPTSITTMLESVWYRRSFNHLSTFSKVAYQVAVCMGMDPLEPKIFSWRSRNFGFQNHFA